MIPNPKRLAQRVIRTCARVKPGEVVAIFGGKHHIPLMEELSMECGRVGAVAWTLLSSDRVARSWFTEAPAECADREYACWNEWRKQVNVLILLLPHWENPKAVYAGVPPERLAKHGEAAKRLREGLNESGLREVIIQFPRKEDAALAKTRFSTCEKTHWAAVNADHEWISKKGEAIRKILQGSKEVKVTSPSGTDFSFSVGTRPIFLDDGVISEEDAKHEFFIQRDADLPAGSVFFAPVETSANGKVRIPRWTCSFKTITNVSFEFENGKMKNFRAKTGGKYFEEEIVPYTGPKDMFGLFGIGLNPRLKALGDFLPSNAAGGVWFWLGHNTIVGGNNDTQSLFVFPIARATAEVDGKAVIRDGKLL